MQRPVKRLARPLVKRPVETKPNDSVLKKVNGSVAKLRERRERKSVGKSELKLPGKQVQSLANVLAKLQVLWQVEKLVPLLALKQVKKLPKKYLETELQL